MRADREDSPRANPVILIVDDHAEVPLGIVTSGISPR
jgi:hypothetical protein